MKLVVQVKLLPTPEQASALDATLRACNRAATHTSHVAFAKKLTDRNGLQREVYTDLKATFGLSAQPAVRVVKKVVDAHATLQANLRAGTLGPSTSRRYRKAISTPISFRLEAAQPFDDRCLSWQYDARTVSIWTVDGRMKGIRFTCSPDQLKTLVQHRKGESDLVRRGGKWLLIATCDIPEPEPYQPVDWVGVDRGIVNLATTSDGTNHQGRSLGRYRRRQAGKRAELQRKQTRSATRRLARRAYKERRHATHVNHRISKEIVSVAQRTGRGIAVEELGGIRERVRLRRDQRGTLSSWNFHQLGRHLAYKARRAGVPFLEVDAAYTSQRCPRCGHTERANRPDRNHFRCRRCGLAGPADVVAGVNVRDRARSAWVFVTAPAPSP
ncbi:transposase [Streptomyces europaeiscabiei]|uniref:Transposase n=1 Tax=Streptomyces europaeiscabiei TaxID=146819 RepID=A0ABU4NNX7_9ACTN|nr:transposase [Streptomyces europaeiscabiei]MDX2760677.1 transposase [Streptomyces europaeiscabiei]MDX3548114.1 transposase [Streptomyces europaeiscabiei]MDX3556033.1 transposase [Streptomyces europaeiscabiei]MDX3703474.1 transposase [Streptomyces europaeiscabiei]MDX3846139.1 transposase [Streptomyces europaeiscabiei]